LVNANNRARTVALWTLGILLCALASAGCVPGSGRSAPTNSSSGAPDEPQTVIISAEYLDDGRLVGGYAEGKIGEELANVFFSLRINKAELTAVYEGQTPRRGRLYLVANITVANVFAEPINMWTDDFLVRWGDGDGDYAYPLRQHIGTELTDEYTLDVGEAADSALVFEVPVPEGRRKYSICYTEYYADDVEGNSYYIIFELTPPLS